MRLRVRVEEGVSAVAGFLTLLSVVWRDWIEVVFRVHPDHHSGSLEWAVVTVLALVAATAWLASRLERRRLSITRQPTPAPGAQGQRAAVASRGRGAPFA